MSTIGGEEFARNSPGRSAAVFRRKNAPKMSQARAAGTATGLELLNARL